MRSIRQSLENQLREVLDFPRRKGHGWQNFPTARLGEAHLKVDSLVGEEKNLARLAGKGDQLTMFGDPARPPSTPEKPN